MNTANEASNNMFYKFRSQFSKKFKLFVTGLLFVFLAGFIYTWVSSPTYITVTGSSEINVPADSAIVTFTLVSSDADVSLAVATLEDKIDSMSNLLITNWGILESDIYESQVTVVTTSSGYQASTDIGVKTAQVPRTGELIASLYKNGASYVGQPILAVENMDNYESQALKDAIADAKKSANHFAFKNLRLLKKVVNIEQSTSDSTSTVSRNYDTSGQEGAEFAIQSGIVKIQKNVAVSYMVW